MNWLTSHLETEIGIKDTVLDLGCGLMEPYKDSKIKEVIGVDVFKPYLDVIKKDYKVFHADLVWDMLYFVDKSFDVVCALDVIEHIEKKASLELINHMERIARKKVVIFTPSKWDDNKLKNGLDAWGYSNKRQEHKCLYTKEELEGLGYDCKFIGSENQMLAVKVVK